MQKADPTVIIGAGPAGLAAAYELSKLGLAAEVFEKDSMVGGLSRTVEYKGFRCDIGGHRFFTKNDYVNGLWREVLGDEFLRRPRLSRIYYGGKFYYYPLRVGNALKNLGLLKSMSVMASLLASRLHPRRPEVSFADWVSNRFGRKLFGIFFKAYTEKVWGISCDELSASWAAQRIRDLSLTTAILNAMGIGKGRKIASLIDEFDYPALGPGQMYETMADKASSHGARIHLQSPVREVQHDGQRVTAVAVADGAGLKRVGLANCLSSMPLDELVLALRPAPPQDVLDAARGLHYRSILTVNLLLDQDQTVPDTWIYIHDPSVVAGRVQFYKNWSPRMVSQSGKSVIGLEYFCTEGDEFWNRSDAQLAQVATDDLRKLKLADAGKVFDSFVVKYAKAYPVYDSGYSQRVAKIRAFLGNLKNLFPVGRYGQFRYNNMDHSILTAHFAVLAMQGQPFDPWSVNVEEEYHEEKK